MDVRVRREWEFTSLAVAWLLLSATLGNAWLQLGGSVVLVILGAWMLPEHRARGVFAAGLAVVVALFVGGVIRLLA